MPNKREGQNKRGLEIFVKFNKWGGQKKREGRGGGGGGVVGISKYPLISVMNEEVKLVRTR